MVARTYNRRERTRLFPVNGQGYTSLDQMKWFFKDSPIPRWSDPMGQLISKSSGEDIDKIVLDHRVPSKNPDENVDGYAEKNKLKMGSTTNDATKSSTKRLNKDSSPASKTKSTARPSAQSKEKNVIRLQTIAQPTKSKSSMSSVTSKSQIIGNRSTEDITRPRSPSPSSDLSDIETESGRETSVTSSDSDSNSNTDSDSDSTSSESSPEEKPKKYYVTQGSYYGIMRRGRVLKGVKENTVFPLPILSGLKRITTETDFKLPWNIYCPTEDGPKAKWRTLKKSEYSNLYFIVICHDSNILDAWLDVSPPSPKTFQRPPCNCTDHCGDDCLNR